jgi:hypothetical protein
MAALRAVASASNSNAGQRDQEPIPSRVGHPKGGQQRKTLAGGKTLGPGQDRSQELM